MPINNDGLNENVPRGTLLLLEDYCAELIKWNRSINLVSRRDSQSVDALMQRHVADCAQVLAFIPAEAIVLDVGSGAGLPGMVLAICGVKGIVLVEPDHKKCAFLRHVAAKLNVECVVKTMGMEVYNHGLHVDVIVSRAFASCKRIVAGCFHNMDISTKLILFKSAKQIDEELCEMSSLYHFTLQVNKSQVNNESRIIILSDIRLK